MTISCVIQQVVLLKKRYYSRELRVAHTKKFVVLLKKTLAKSSGWLIQKHELFCTAASMFVCTELLASNLGPNDLGGPPFRCVRPTPPEP